MNNQPSEYWKGALAAYGFEFDEQMTLAARSFSAANLEPFNHFLRSGMAFRRIV